MEDEQKNNQEEVEKEKVIEKSSSESEAQSKPGTKKNSGDKKNTGMAALAYMFFVIPLVSGYKEDEFVMYHVKQGAVLFFTGVILSMIPFIGWLLNFGVFILFLIGLKNALDGKKKQLPLIGQFGEKINF